MARGFTLLEMLVVLVILGLAASVVAPPLARTLERVREAGDRDDVARGLEALPARAREAGQALEFRAGEPIVIRDRPWPAGWAVVPITALRVEANGFCEGGTLQVVRPSGPISWTLAAPDCRVEVADAP